MTKLDRHNSSQEAQTPTPPTPLLTPVHSKPKSRGLDEEDAVKDDTKHREM